MKRKWWDMTGKTDEQREKAQARLSARRQRYNAAYGRLPGRVRKVIRRAAEDAYPPGPISIREGDVLTKAVGAFIHFLKPEPTRWWRVIGPDGELVCESSNEKENRRVMGPGDRLQRLWRIELDWWEDA